MALAISLSEAYDIAIVGAGPAGSALANMLARHHKVAVFDKQETPARRIGESLVPATRRILRDMDLLELVESRGYPPYLGNQSAWGADVMQITDFITDPDGPGWHIDRVDFESVLSTAAQARGAHITRNKDLKRCSFKKGFWQLGFADETTAKARIVVDATGRRASLARMLGARPVTFGRTVAVWMLVKDANARPQDHGLSTVISCDKGWWYSVPLTSGRIVALHTDSDLVTKALRQPESFLDYAKQDHLLAPLLKDASAIKGEIPQVTAANSSVLERCAGLRWLAVGDAALALDPLSSRGIFQALYTSLAAAAEIDAALNAGYIDDFELYANHLSEIAATYADHLDLFYGLEHRWSDAPFWKRRQAA